MNRKDVFWLFCRCFQRILFACVLCVFCIIEVVAEETAIPSVSYGITYNSFYCHIEDSWVSVNPSPGPQTFHKDQEIIINHPTLEGHIFTGWDVNILDSSTHYYSDGPIYIDGEYQNTTHTSTELSLTGINETHFMNLRSTTSGIVNFYANWSCDEANYWHERDPNDSFVCTPCTNRYRVKYEMAALPGTLSNEFSLIIGGLPGAAYVPVGTEYELSNWGPAITCLGPSTTTCTLPFGYIFSPWFCTKDSNGEVVTTENNKILNMPPFYITCTKAVICDAANGFEWQEGECRQKSVGLVWNTNYGTLSEANPQSCVYGIAGNLRTVHAPMRTGYTFKGWKLTDWDECGLKSVTIDYGTQDLYAIGWFNERNACSDYQNTPTDSICGGTDFDDLDTYEWKSVFNYGTVYGVSKCSDVSGELAHSGSPGENAGKNCWCKVTKFVSQPGNQCDLTSGKWVFRTNTDATTADCKKNCAFNCSFYVSSNTAFRSALYGQSE